MKAVLFLVVNTLGLQLIYAQTLNFAWAKQMGGTREATGYSVTTDASGNVYTTGSFSGTVDFDPGVGIYDLTTIGGAIFVSKLNSAGGFVWAKKMEGIDSLSGGRGSSITLDASGNVYSTGYFSGTVDFDPGPGIYILSTIGRNGTSFVSKLDASGNFLWAKQMGRDGYDGSGGQSIITDAAGNVYSAGYFADTADFDPGVGIFNLYGGFWNDIYISKLDSAGNFIWAKAPQVFSYFGGFAKSAHLAFDAAANIYCTGYFSGEFDFDPGAGVFSLNAGFWNTYIWKLNAGGNFVWAKQIGGGQFGSAEGIGIAVDPSGNVYSIGAFQGTVDFDPDTGIYNLSEAELQGLYLSKLNSNGNFIWAKQMAGTYWETGRSIALDASGNVYSTGEFAGTVDFDPGPGIYSFTATGNSDMFVSKLNSAGNFVWAKQMGGPGDGTSGNYITVDTNRNIYTTGNFQGTVDFDPGTGIYNLTSIGVPDIFVHKMSQCTNVTSSSITASACSSYILNGQTYTATGVYTQILINSTGCDSIITLDLSINNRYTSINAAACNSYIWNGQTYTDSGIYKDTILLANGCDSIITLNLVINSRSFSVISAAICSGQVYAGHTTAGTYIDTLIAANGCDSIHTLTLTVKPGSFATIDTEICSGQNYGGHTLAGTYTDVLIAANGCDSVRTVNLTVKNNCSIYIPNAFTPNNDGLNDLFKPTINLPLKKFSFIIFNRYGEKIFETYEYGRGWDGTYKGKAQSMGSYVYRITFIDMSGWESENNGTVLLLR